MTASNRTKPVFVHWIDCFYFFRRHFLLMILAGIGSWQLAEAEPIALYNIKKFQSETPGMEFGNATAVIGDINGDSIDDVAVGVPQANSNNSFGAGDGEIRIFSGAASGELLRIIYGTNGENLGESVSWIGDVDGDGVPDILASGPNYMVQSGAVPSGAVYIFSGKIEFGPGNQPITKFAGRRGFSGQRFAYSVSPLGFPERDCQKKWIACHTGDFIVGAPYTQNPYAAGSEDRGGRLYRYRWDHWSSAYNDGALALVNPSTHPVGNQDHYGTDHAQLGSAVSGQVGDLDGDGHIDYVAGAPYTGTVNQPNSGGFRIYSGATNQRINKRSYYHLPTSGIVNLSFGLSTELATSVKTSGLGWSFAGVGDIDGDGHDDIAVGSPFDGHLLDAAQTGSVYVLSGKSLINGVTSFAPGTLLDQEPPVHLVVQTAGMASGVGIQSPIPSDFSSTYIGFGKRLLATRINSTDRFPHLFVAAPESRVNNQALAGAIWGFRGPTTEKPFFEIDSKSVFLTRFGKESGAQLGTSLAGGVDLTEDGKNDLLFSEPAHQLFHPNSTGKVTVMGLCREREPLREEYTVTLSTASVDSTGSVLGLIDLDLDGVEEIVVNRVDPVFGPELLVLDGALFYQQVPLLQKIIGRFPGVYAKKIQALGDVNQDGVNDIIVANPNYSDEGLPWAGTVRIYSGMTALGRNGQTEIIHEFLGTSPSERMGSALAVLGDLNQDGYYEYAIGSEPNTLLPGYVRVFDGATHGLIREHLEEPSNNDTMGWEVAVLGDLGNSQNQLDGINDYAYSRVTAEGVFGHLSIRSGANGDEIHEMFGAEPGDTFGHRISPLGDVDQDGFADFLVSSPNFSGEATQSKVQAFSGRTFQMLYEVFGKTPSDRFGSGIARIGDVVSSGGRKDQISDFLVFGRDSFGYKGKGRIEIRSGADGELIETIMAHSEEESLAGKSLIGSTADIVAGVLDAHDVLDINGDGQADILFGVVQESYDPEWVAVKSRVRGVSYENDFRFFTATSNRHSLSDAFPVGIVFRPDAGSAGKIYGVLGSTSNVPNTCAYQIDGKSGSQLYPIQCQDSYFQQSMTLFKSYVEDSNSESNSGLIESAGLVGCESEFTAKLNLAQMQSYLGESFGGQSLYHVVVAWDVEKKKLTVLSGHEVLEISIASEGIL